MTDFGPACEGRINSNGEAFPKDIEMTIYKGVYVDTGHLLTTTEVEPEEAAKIFGKCNRRHGHRFYIYLAITGPVRGPSYMVINLSAVKAKLLEVVNTADHNELHHIVNFSTDDTKEHRVPATSEHFAYWAYSKLAPFVKQLNPDARISSIKVQRGDDHGVEYRPPNGALY